MADPRASRAQRARTRQGLPTPAMVALVPLAAWLAVTPFMATALGLELGVPLRLEIIDHVVPGVVTLGAATAALVLRTRPVAATAFLVGAGVCLLAGLFSFSTHVPLLGQASQGIVPWGTALVHTLPGFVVMVIALVALVPALRAAD